MTKNIFVLLAATLASQALGAAEPGLPRPAATTLAHACAGCHGTFGHSRHGTPVIAGRHETDFTKVMREFKYGQRASSIMNRIARGYADEDFQELARFFRNQ